MPSSRWVVLAVCTLAFTQTHMHRVGVAPLIPTFIADFGITYAAAGTLMTAYFWTYTAVQVPIGVLTDRLGARRVMLTSLSFLVLGVVAFSLSGSYAQSVIARCLVGLGTAAIWLPGLRLINEWFAPSERGRATGIFSAGGGAGGTTALLLIPLVAEQLGWRLAYALLLIPLVLSLALVFVVVRAGTPGILPTDVGGTVLPVSGAGTGGPLVALRRVLGTPALWPFNVSVLCSYGAYIGLVTWLPTFLVEDAGLSRSMAGLVTSLMTAGTVVSWPMAGLISDRMGRRKPIYLFSQAMSAVMCLAFALIVPGSGVWVAVAVAGATGVLLGGMVTPFVMVAELFPAELVGTASGVVNTFCFLGALLIPVALGGLLDATRSFPAAFTACAVIQALALLVGAFTRETGVAGRAIMAA